MKEMNDLSKGQSSSTNHPKTDTPLLNPKQANIVDNPVVRKDDIIDRLAPRPNYGRVGRPITLNTNFFEMKIPPDGFFYSYQLDIEPKCSKELRWKVFHRLTPSFGKSYLKYLKPIFDGSRKLYTAKPLPARFHEAAGYSTHFKLPWNEGSHKEFKITLRNVSRISLWNFRLALGHILNNEVCQETMEALDLVMRKTAALNFTTIGKRFFITNANYLCKPEDGMSNWIGIHQAVIPCIWKPMLNIDVASAVFHQRESCLDVLCRAIGIGIGSNELLQINGLNELQRKKFCDEIKGLKVDVTHLQSELHKNRVVDVTELSASRIIFPRRLESGETIMCTVKDYFDDRYSIKLQYSHLPCLQAGGPKRPKYLPIELCTISGHQLIRSKSESAFLTRSRPDRRKSIMQHVKKAQLNQDCFVNNFGIKIVDQMITVTGRVLPPPAIEYRDSGVQTVETQKGSWRINGRKLYQGVTITTWAVACFVGQNDCSKTQLESFFNQLLEVATQLGLQMERHPVFLKYVEGVSNVESFFRRRCETHANLQLLFAVLPEGSEFYGEVKRFGDTLYSLPTQCLLARKLDTFTREHLENVCCKINAKLGGINNIYTSSLRPKLFHKPVIFIGIYINRRRSSPPQPAFAAAVGSLDEHPSRYSVQVRVQAPTEDVVQDLEYMTKQLMINFHRSTNGLKPERIIVYRYHVAVENFKKVLSFEMRAIRKVCVSLELEYQPGITFIAVQDKQRTQFFPDEKSGETIPVGTIVDSIIIDSQMFDFYLCSHSDEKETSRRPRKYTVLWDDCETSTDDLQLLTYQLCYSCVRCTKSVSVPAPVYYARLAASRASLHLKSSRRSERVANTNSSRPGEYTEQTLEAMSNEVLVQNISEIGMYFA